jgi:hypothetical protein
MIFYCNMSQNFGHNLDEFLRTRNFFVGGNFIFSPPVSVAGFKPVIAKVNYHCAIATGKGSRLSLIVLTKIF